METGKQNNEEANKDLKIKMYDIHSSKVKKIGWYFCQKSFQGVCVAEFANEVRYMYFPVQKAVFDGLFKAESKGKYFTENIEKAEGIIFQKLGQPKLDL